MASRIEEYAVIRDTQTVALVGVTAPLIGYAYCALFRQLALRPFYARRNMGAGWWRRPRDPTNSPTIPRRDACCSKPNIRPMKEPSSSSTSCPVCSQEADIVRIVEGRLGGVPMRMELIVRFDYGSIVPWARRTDGMLRAVAGPDAVLLPSETHTRGENCTTLADFTVSEGQRGSFVMAWHRCHEPDPPARDPVDELTTTEAWWKEWSKQCS